jgi:hypothetical protein
MKLFASEDEIDTIFLRFSAPRGDMKNDLAERILDAEKTF